MKGLLRSNSLVILNRLRLSLIKGLLLRRLIAWQFLVGLLEIRGSKGLNRLRLSLIGPLLQKRGLLNGFLGSLSLHLLLLHKLLLLLLFILTLHGLLLLLKCVILSKVATIFKV